MSLKYLGSTLDIHGGGQDLVFPHHENEIAQTESFTGIRPFVKYWLHNGLVQLSGEKMSKSLGNLITIREALGKYSADAIRIFVLHSHYRSPLTYSEEALGAAEEGTRRLQQAAWAADPSVAKEDIVERNIGTYRERFTRAMDDDFNTPQALAALFDLAREINRRRDEGFDIRERRELLRELAGVLGLRLPELDTMWEIRDLLSRLDDKRRVADSAIELLEKAGESQLATNFQSEATLFILGGKPESFLQQLVSTRNQLREAKKFKLADGFRSILDEAGIALEDTPQGTVWKRKR